MSITSDELIDDIFNINPKTLSNCIFRNTEIYARVYKVYDGDTISVIFKFNKEFIKYSCRIVGIDTPELRTKNTEEKKLGIIARDYLRELVLEKIIKIKVLDFDKYGRLLINLYTPDDDKDISNMMVAKKLNGAFNAFICVCVYMLRCI